jgi:hypothetical protein
MQKYLSLRSGSRARLKLLGYYAQRVCTSRRLRRATTRALVAGLGALHGQPGARAKRGRGSPSCARKATCAWKGC